MSLAHGLHEILAEIFPVWEYAKWHRDSPLVSSLAQYWRWSNFHPLAHLPLCCYQHAFCYMSRFLKLLQAPQYSPLDLNDSESGAEEFEDSLQNIPIAQYPPSHVRSPKSNALYFRAFLRMTVILVGFSILTVIVRLRLRSSNAWVEKSGNFLLPLLKANNVNI